MIGEPPGLDPFVQEPKLLWLVAFAWVVLTVFYIALWG